MLAKHPNLPKHNPNATVSSVGELLSLEGSVTEIVVDNGIGDSELTELDLSRFSQLKRLEIGDYCCMSVNELKLIGLSELESVVIGENSFTKFKNSYGNDPNRHFYLQSCPKLKSLTIGRYSFSDYTVCVIESVSALETIEMGYLNTESYNFYYASLELKSILVHRE